MFIDGMFLGTILLEIKVAKHLNDRIIAFEARKQCFIVVNGLNPGVSVVRVV